MNYLSLFSGIEAATEAWGPLGWSCVGVSEIEPFPCALLAQRHPGVPNLGNVKKIAFCAVREPEVVLGLALNYPRSRLAAEYGRLAELMINMPNTDLMVFGSPCQDLSVAGKRKGLDGVRSGLFFAAVFIGRWLRRRKGCRFWLWENVPGAFTSNIGRDFAAVVDALSGLEPGTTQVPPKGWGTEGCALGEEAMVEWATLDAQWFGVAQRRRRVFALADSGNWSDRPPILLEPEGMRGDSPPSRRKGEDVAGTPTTRARSGCPGGGDAEHRPVLSDTVATLDASYSRLQGCSGQDLNHGHSHLVAQCFGGNNQSGAIDVSTALNASGTASGTASGRMDFESETFVAYMPHRTLMPDGGVDEGFAEREVCDALHCSPHNNKSPLIAFNSNAQPDQMVFDPHITAPLTCNQYAAVAFQSSQSGVRIDQVHATLDSNNGSRRHNGAIVNMRVRRLTPKECERLQAFKDGHTLVTMRGRPAADGPRYKALGNSMCVTVMHWIGRQIDFAWRWF